MARGGSKPGERRGGRQKGSVNRKTERFHKAVTEYGTTPLDFLLAAMADDENPMPMRLDAAKSAAPYVHPRLAAVEVSGNKDAPLGLTIVTGVPRADA